MVTPVALRGVCLLRLMCLIPPSSVGVLGEALRSGSDCEMVEPQSFFSPQKASMVLCGESRKQELRWNAGKSTAGIQKED